MREEIMDHVSRRPFCCRGFVWPLAFRLCQKNFWRDPANGALQRKSSRNFALHENAEHEIFPIASPSADPIAFDDPINRLERLNMLRLRLFIHEGLAEFADHFS